MCLPQSEKKTYADAGERGGGAAAKFSEISGS